MRGNAILNPGHYINVSTYALGPRPAGASGRCVALSRRAIQSSLEKTIDAPVDPLLGDEVTSSH
ncbi:hypothetical protein ASD39_07875 [Sphingomonas sp. Root50]|nr:hypothetical protein ASD17_05250 [Sphingomonas sp. Root1294]KQY67825.1 hypothetical protein ASD39_07875 [Sphingomonas sp. Root50]KRB88749.1 hypothetical protein ASE22_20225 [Sphingomonas sp. Root720]